MLLPNDIDGPRWAKLGFAFVWMLVSSWARPALAAKAEPWWKQAVIYQIYPRSFQDSDGDGVGDLKGIQARLPYLKQLGVSAVWLSPVYQSPMKDFGYDISDYEAVDPLFGTMADLDQLIASLHRHGLKVIMDLVINHTSSEHPWFKEAASSKRSAKRNWYVWRDAAAGGGAPNNWRGVFAGSAWTLDAASGQYYYHAFLPEQPDLNWRSPEVREAIFKIMRFWLDKGIDGFRVDAIAQLVEDARGRSEPPGRSDLADGTDYGSLDHSYTTDLPETHRFLRQMRQVVERYPGDRVLISEAYLPLPKVMTYYGKPGAEEAQLPFNFHLIGAPWTAKAAASYAAAYEAALPRQAWPNWVLGNHDRSRLASRIGREQAKVAAMLLLTLRGTPTIYYGDELGMEDAPVPPALVQDPEEKREPGKGLGRDPERTPLAWTSAAKGDFTTGQPWLPLAPEHEVTNVEAESRAPASMLRFYQALLALRAKSSALSLGSYQQVLATNSIFVYQRRFNEEQWIVALNFTGQLQALTWPDSLPASSLHLILSSLPDRAASPEALRQLQPHEALLLRVGGKS